MKNDCKMMWFVIFGLSKRKNRIINNFSIILIHALTGMFGIFSGIAVGDGTTVHHCEKGHFSISTPSAWVVKELAFKDTKGILDLSGPQKDGFHFVENVNIVIVPAPGIQVSELNARGIELLKKNVSQFNLLDQGTCQIGMQPATWIIHTFWFEDQILKVLKYTVINGNNCYMITCTSVLDTYEQYHSIFEKIACSIVFDDPQPPYIESTAVTSEDSGYIAFKIGAFLGVIVFLLGIFSKKTSKSGDKTDAILPQSPKNIAADDVRKILSKAVKIEMKGEWNEAIKLYEKIISIYPLSEEATCAKGAIDSLKNRIDRYGNNDNIKEENTVLVQKKKWPIRLAIIIVVSSLLILANIFQITENLSRLAQEKGYLRERCFPFYMVGLGGLCVGLATILYITKKYRLSFKFFGAASCMYIIGAIFSIANDGWNDDFYPVLLIIASISFVLRILVYRVIKLTGFSDSPIHKPQRIPLVQSQQLTLFEDEPQSVAGKN